MFRVSLVALTRWAPPCPYAGSIAAEMTDPKGPNFVRTVEVEGV